MSRQTPRPKINLSRLRDIGWSLWDPIGLLEPGQRWDDEECQRFADEYDDYLLHAATDLRRGATDDEVASYLVGIEIEQMCLGSQTDTYRRARRVAEAIRADTEIWMNAKD